MPSKKPAHETEPAATPPDTDNGTAFLNGHLPQLCALIAAGIALLALAGWQTNARFLAGQWGDYIPMAPSTALAFLLLGGALFSSARWPRQRWSRLFALAALSLVSLLGLLVLGQLITGVDLGVEQALSRTNEVLGRAPLGRMSPLTALSFLLECAALFVLLVGQGWRHAFTAAALLAAAATAVNFIVLTGYAYGEPLLYGGSTVPTALPTAAAFALVGLGLIRMTVHDVPALRAWSRASLRGRLLRAFLPTLLSLLLIEGWLEVRLEPILHMNSALWHSLAALAVGVLILAVTWWIAGRTADAIEQAEAALRESEERFRSLYENATIGLYRTTPDGRTLLANPAIVNMLGYDSFLELAERNLEKDGNHADYPRSHFREQIERDGEVKGQESIWKRKDGTTIFVRESTRVVRDAQGGALYYEGTVEDITERKQAERELAERSRLLESLFTNHLTCLALLDRDFNFIRVNEAYARAGGREVSEFPGHNHFEFYPSEAQTIFEDVVRTKKPFQVSARPFEYADHPEWGVTYWDWTLVPILDRAGEVEFLVFSLNNITERKQAEETLRHRLAELEALHTVSVALRMAQTRDEALPILLDETLATLETEAGVIWLYHPDSGELRAAASRGWFHQLDEAPMKPGEGIAGAVFASGQAHVSVEFQNDPAAHATTREQIPSGWGGACVPIRSGAITVGVLFVSVPLPRQITTEQVKLLESLAEMAGAALHRMRLLEETVRQVERLQALRAVDQAISGNFDSRMTLNVILEQTASQLQVDAAAVLLLNPHAYTLEYAAGRGFRARDIEHSQVRLGEGPAGRAALERRTIVISDFRLQSADFPQSAIRNLQSEMFVAFCAAPLIVKGQVKGVLEVFQRAPLNPNQDWISFLETLAGQAAIAIDDAQLFDGLQRSNVELSLAYDATIAGWSHALDLRDRETEGHTLRVTEITLRLAKALGVAETELVHLRRGALLHDIGKMGVPDSILLKPGPLTDDEWAIMRQHPQHAHDMLSPINYLRPALDIPYCHHEKWDGSGYPRGLKGEQIPLVARLFALVDVWDALRSDRPYRQAWPEEKVIEYIQAESGSHFDPKVVEEFLRMTSGE